MPLASDIMDQAAAQLNDASKTIYSYAVQLPFLKSAWNKLQLELIANGIDVTREVSAVIDVAANSTYVTTPSDMIQPIIVRERADGTSDLFVEVEEVDDIPEIDQVDEIIYWSWREEVLYINSPATAREVKVTYKKSLNPATGSSSTLNVLNSTEYLACMTASLCARYIGENPTRAAELYAEAELAKDLLLRSEVNTRQSGPVRPRSYGASKKYMLYEWE
jgi:hypothetical protein